MFIGVKLDATLDALLRARAEELGESLSDVVRDILRRALGVVGDERTAGYLAGRQEGYAAVRKAFEEAVSFVPAAPK